MSNTLQPESINILSAETVAQIPLFTGAEPMLIDAVIVALKSRSFAAGQSIIKIGETANEMYIVGSGSVDIFNDQGKHLKHLGVGECFGEVGLLITANRTANVVAACPCELFVLEKSDLNRIMQASPHFTDSICALAKERYNIVVTSADLMGA